MRGAATKEVSDTVIEALDEPPAQHLRLVVGQKDIRQKLLAVVDTIPGVSESVAHTSVSGYMQTHGPIVYAYMKQPSQENWNAIKAQVTDFTAFQRDIREERRRLYSQERNSTLSF